MKTGFWMTTTLVLAVTLASGCGQSATAPAPGNASQTDAHEHGKQTASTDQKDGADDHSGWWCNEHGVPEEVCALCNSKVAAEFQKKGDWCKEHDRPDSQCFLCHPELEARFAAQYEAKYGKKPPRPEG